MAHIRTGQSVSSATKLAEHVQDLNPLNVFHALVPLSTLTRLRKELTAKKSLNVI
jgi:hypothetical protein